MRSRSASSAESVITDHGQEFNSYRMEMRGLLALQREHSTLSKDWDLIAGLIIQKRKWFLEKIVLKNDDSDLFEVLKLVDIEIELAEEFNKK